MVLLCSLDGLVLTVGTRLGSNCWVILLLLPAECWDYRCVPAYLAGIYCHHSRIWSHGKLSSSKCAQVQCGSHGFHEKWNVHSWLSEENSFPNLSEMASVHPVDLVCLLHSHSKGNTFRISVCVCVCICKHMCVNSLGGRLRPCIPRSWSYRYL